MGSGENTGENVGSNTGSSNRIIPPSGGGGGWPPVGATDFREYNCEGGVVGARADSDPSGLDSQVGDWSIFDNVANGGYVHSGTQSIRFTAASPNNGLGFGGFLQPPRFSGYFPTEGDDFWWRYWIRFQDGWVWTTDAEKKFFRFKLSESGDSNIRYIQSYPTTVGYQLVNSECLGSNEGCAGTSFWDRWGGYVNINPALGTAPEEVANDGWCCIENHIRFSATPGNGLWRSWRNGNLVFDDPFTATLRSSSGVTLKSLFHFTQFGAPTGGTQYCWVDDQKYCVNGDPGDTDANGNPFIGLT